MEDQKDVLKVVLGFAAVAFCFYAYLKLYSSLYERGLTSRRSPKVEIQTLFHGNTKDKDQI